MQKDDKIEVNFSRNWLLMIMGWSFLDPGFHNRIEGELIIIQHFAPMMIQMNKILPPFGILAPHCTALSFSCIWQLAPSLPLSGPTFLSTTSQDSLTQDPVS